MNSVFEKIKEKLLEISEPARPVGWTRKIEIVPTKAAIDIIDQVAQEHNNGWLPVEERLPKDDKYILLSFSNFSIPCVGRYEEDAEGGAFYIGDEEETCVSQDLFVNAWMPLPTVYRPEGE